MKGIISVIFFALTILSQTADPANTDTTVFVKSGATGGGGKTFESPIGSLKGAYDLLAETSDQAFSIKEIKDETVTDVLKAEAMAFDKSAGVMIGGITNAAGTNEKVKIGCDAKSNNDLFTCKKEISFGYLMFDFPITLSEGTEGLKANTDPSALIHPGTESASLSISNCRFDDQQREKLKSIL
ncbi:uncharacterized protein MONOS_9861 [Monocercomonoides exilis]|uniref:uncharacterized protein n=1 Tax=Monocercomonoides exilis TaxID=2049356 RepID=UPI003559BE92|nr:hypothetical protein MONOS_9861 [Monocercomonoides exilis]|eukprot:MONOS_9861.1-p1 / transcript=MONOS_9861.1 / gene=MONOS_9861 / organism=Monocercomonoides_exilis_PA203 / gene_product=unspecified product / transcript_product=unspecified product / location=Mono_scaffold00423:23543-24094(+) / protein_length=184 / sequence_SO=supercontig / SO=protein_coding / is_pseudo=false